jgi:ATP synthase F1 delta subunit
MSAGQVARVYATALFAAAADAGSVARTRDDLHEFAAALERSQPLAGVVFDPQIDPDVKRRVVRELTRDADHLAAGGLAVLLDKGRIAVLPAVIDEYDRLAAAAAKVVDVELTTAVPASAEVERKVVAQVEEATGLSVRLTSKVDPQIVGGLVLRVGDVIIDGSVHSRIGQLRKRLQLADVRGDE